MDLLAAPGALLGPGHLPAVLLHRHDHHHPLLLLVDHHPLHRRRRLQDQYYCDQRSFSTPKIMFNCNVLSFRLYSAPAPPQCFWATSTFTPFFDFSWVAPSSQLDGHCIFCWVFFVKGLEEIICWLLAFFLLLCYGSTIFVLGKHQSFFPFFKWNFAELHRFG